LAHIWPGIIPATNTLLAAEKFATINYALGYAEYPQQEFDFMWKKLVESMDHNHDGQGGRIGDNRKIEYEQLSVIRGGEILRDSLRNIAERVEVPIPDSFPIVVFNPLGWERDDVVRAHVTLYGNVGPYEIDAFRKGMRLLDEMGNSVPFFVEEWSENISRAIQLVFVARGVPSLGYKTYYLVAADKPDVFPETATVSLDRQKDQREPRRALESDVLENSFYRLSVDLATGGVTLFDKVLGRDVCRDMEVVALEERGGNYIGKEPPSGRTIVSMVDSVEVLENNPVRAVVLIRCRIADIPITQRLTLYQGIKQLDIENTVEWRSDRPRFIRVRQLFPVASPNAALNYGIPFGANSANNLMPNAETIREDEITNESWRRSRHIHDWIHAGAADGGLTIATDHQQVRLEDDVICAEMVRGTKYVSVKVGRGDEITSMYYPPPGTYVFRYSLSSGPGDWKKSKAYRSGIGWNNPLLPISVADEITSKSLPPTRSFCALKQDNLVLSALKKADLGPSILLRAYEIEGSPVKTPVEFLGRRATFAEVNLLEEDIGGASQKELRGGPFVIKTIKLDYP
jgi:alpha-mannosidase